MQAVKGARIQRRSANAAPNFTNAPQTSAETEVAILGSEGGDA
jgi:hypothetical protein